jgi:hypothetical protein
MSWDTFFWPVLPGTPDAAMTAFAGGIMPFSWCKTSETIRNHASPRRSTHRNMLHCLQKRRAKSAGECSGLSTPSIATSLSGLISRFASWIPSVSSLVPFQSVSGGTLTDFVGQSCLHRTRMDPHQRGSAVQGSLSTSCPSWRYLVTSSSSAFAGNTHGCRLPITPRWLWWVPFRRLFWTANAVSSYCYWNHSPH